MSVHDALRFMEAVRKNPALQEQVRSAHDHTGLEQLPRLGREVGLSFTVDDLRAAYRHDWAMRWLRERIRENGAL